MLDDAARLEWRDGWQVPFVGLLGYAGSLTFIHSLGAFMPSLMGEFGWSRTDITLGMTCGMIVGIIAGPVVGLLIDKFGARNILLAGIPLFVLGLSSLGSVSGEPWHWWALCVLSAVTSCFVGATGWVAASASRFVAARGLALAITLCGSGLATATVPILATMYLDAMDWRKAYPALALTWALPVMVLTWIFVRPSGDRTTAKSISYSRRIPWSQHARIFRSRPFLTLLGVGAIFASITLALTMHLIPILRENKLESSTAAAIAGSAGIAGIVGRLVSGLLLDRYPTRLVAAVALSLPALSCVLLVFAEDSLLWATVAVIFLGLSQGAELDIIIYLFTRYFGTQGLGGAFGVMLGAFGLFVGFGPMLASWIADNYGGYGWFLLGASPLFPLCALLISTLPAVPPLTDR